MIKTPETRPLQFGIKSMLGVMVIAALSLAVSARVPGLPALILGIVGIPVQLAFLSVWNGWSWRGGVLLLFAIAMVVTPADPYSMWLFAAFTIGIYTPTMLVLKRMRR